MSVPKSLAKRQRLQRKRIRKQKAQDRRRRKRGDLVWGDLPWAMPPVGEVKMSEVLGEFVEPFARDIDERMAYRQLLELGVVAWNAALLPPSEWDNLLDATLAKAPLHSYHFGKLDTRVMVEQLIRRKLCHVGHIDHKIIDFHLEDLGDHYHLVVFYSL